MLSTLANRIATAALIYVAVLAVVLIIGGEDANASTGKRCTAQGRAVSLADASRMPDVSRTLTRGDTFVPGSAEDAGLSFSDVHAYPLHGGATRTYVCTARHGVDQWDEYRTLHGRVIATYDGAMFTARATVTVAAWKG